MPGALPDAAGVWSRSRRSEANLGENPAGTEMLTQATLRLRSEMECERVIRLSHQRGIASAMAYRGPEDGRTPIFVLVIDETRNMERFLPELQQEFPEARISLVREEMAHAAPPDFLRGGALRPKPFRAQVGHMAWIFAGGALGAAARIAIESGARYVSAGHDAFPWGTMAVNVSGSFAIAILGTLIAERFVGERERMFWVLGFLGSFTTFSSFVSQASEGWRSSVLLGGFYGVGSVILGLAAAFLGIWLTRKALRWQ